MRDESPADLKCLLCGEALDPPLVHPSLLTVQRAEGYNALHDMSFLVHDQCARKAAHPAVADHVAERLDNAT
jgi:hypothetical protein